MNGRNEDTLTHRRRVSLRTVERLSVYRRALEELAHDGVQFVHSHELAALVGVSPAQLRRDLASFGTFGNIARGYDVREMAQTIAEIIGTTVIQNIGLVGVGHLGRALLAYGGFEERGFHIAAAFDSDPGKIGRVFAGRRCYSVEQLDKVVPELELKVLILAARPEGLQAVVDKAAQAGVRGFLNFVPKSITVPSGCFVEQIDISAKLEKLSFLVRRGGR
ncbi:MAG: redox-sensing transcriptional repressor Rex [Thermoleophilia bacterium]|nr:redox-sensing transcriptional repressor Rex [Thermoleophilia bacterium]